MFIIRRNVFGSTDVTYFQSFQHGWTHNVDLAKVFKEYVHARTYVAEMRGRVSENIEVISLR